MPDRDEHRTRFYELNWLGRAVYLGGTAVRLTANLIDHTLERTAEVAAEAERAFYSELDPNVEDAKIIAEEDEQETR